MSRFGRKLKQAPEGFEYIEPTLTALDNELREKVNEPHEGLRKTESQWPVHQINWQKSRYVYDMYYTYERISREVYDYCISNKLIDAGLIAKWKKTGYERLCSTYTINPRNYKFGTVSICRVPKQYLAPGIEIEDPITGCRGCASGPGGSANIFGNKYGQYLAAIQVAREERLLAKALEAEEEIDDNDEDLDEAKHDGDEKLSRGLAAKAKSSGLDREENTGPVGAPDGSSGKNKSSIWLEDEEEVEITEDMYGTLDVDAEKEAKAAAKNASKMKSSSSGFDKYTNHESSHSHNDHSSKKPKY